MKECTGNKNGKKNIQVGVIYILKSVLILDSKIGTCSDDRINTLITPSLLFC